MAWRVDVTVAGSITHPYGAGFERVDHGGTSVISRSVDVDDRDATAGSIALTSADPADSDRLGWARLSWGDSLLDFWDDLDADGALERRSDVARPATGSLARRAELAAGASVTFTFVISWYFPNRYGWPSTGLSGTEKDRPATCCSPRASLVSVRRLHPPRPDKRLIVPIAAPTTLPCECHCPDVP